MQSKNKRPYDPEQLPPSQRLRSNVVDLAASNVVSSARLMEMMTDINRVAPAEFSDATRAATTNPARKLRHVFMKRNQWPHLYWAQIRCRDVKSGQEMPKWVAFRLPHEYVNAIMQHGTRERILSTERMDPLTLAHLRKCEQEAGCNLLAVGLWGDGMPCNWDRSQSVDAFAINFPGCPEMKSLRLPVTAFSHKHISEHTWHDVSEIVAWSLNILGTGIAPTCRHDGSAWINSDKTGSRARHNPPRSQGCTILQRCCLAEVRGDWKFMNDVFKFPAHNTNAGCCWRCTCTPEQVIVYCM